MTILILYVITFVSFYDTQATSQAHGKFREHGMDASCEDSQNSCKIRGPKGYSFPLLLFCYMSAF
jgi:hypothetical protein